MPTPAKDAPTDSSAAGRGSESSGPGAAANVSGNVSLPSLPSISLAQVANPRRLLWLGGLVAVGAVGVLEWPVVAAVGVGSYVAEQFAKSDIRQDLQHPPSPSPQ